MHLTKKCIPYIEKLKDTLHLFDWSCSSLDGADLAKANCWDNLEQMHMNYSKNVSPLIAKLAHSKNLEVLDVSGCKISKSDLQNIATMKNLVQLNLSAVKLTSQDLAILATMPNLDTLEVVDCGVYKQAIPVLKKFPALKHLQINSNKFHNPNFNDIENALINTVAVY
jgi:uncharacterized protein YjbI with pentapeptide repeats